MSQLKSWQKGGQIGHMRIGKENFILYLKKRDERALEYVLEEYGGLLMSIIKKHLFCLPGLQDDCMNEVLFKIWKYIGQFDEKKSSFKNWIAGIARYQAIDYLRKYKKDLELTDIYEVEPGEEDKQLIELIEREISEELEQMLSCLTKEDRELFLKLFWEDKEMEQVSRETGLKKETIYQRVSRGKKKIIRFRESKEGH